MRQYWDRNLDPRRRAIIGGIFIAMALLTLISGGFENVTYGGAGMSAYIALVVTFILARRGFYADRLSVFVDRDGERIEVRQKVRPVLKADRVQPLHNPETMTGDEALEYYMPLTRVIGIVHKDQIRAYPLAVLSYREVVHDLVGGDPLTVTWSPFCYTARVFVISSDSEMHFVPQFGFTGRVLINSPVMYDARSRVRWIQYLGAPLEGPNAGTRLPEIPSINTTLGAWLDAYPESDVVSDHVAPTQDLFDNYYAGGRAGMHRAPHRDARWPAKEIVAGVDIEGDACAFPMSWLQIEPVVNETVGGTPLVVAYEQGSASVVAFCAQTSSGRTLTFETEEWDEDEDQDEEDESTDVLEDEIDDIDDEDEPQPELGDESDDDADNDWEDWEDEEELEYEPMMIYDVETESRWHATNGTCVEGELKGEQLEPVVAGLSFWFAWTNFHPSTRLPPRPDLSSLMPDSKKPEKAEADEK
jgi:hypothetical protein